MIIGSHNSFSYAQPKKWWQKIGRFIGRCQKYNIQHQYHHGCRFFDIRLKFDSNGKPLAAHGLIEYDINIEEELKWLILRANKGNHIYLRLTLETSKENIVQESYFINFCRKISKNEYVLCFNGTRKFDWKTIYKFDYNPKLEQLVGSMQSGYGKIWPWLWYRINRNKIKSRLEELRDTELLVLLDFND